jgi:D-alanyl-D-alanine carboxypeptidase (penicillin-binding protein 5/6)
MFQAVHPGMKKCAALLLALFSLVAFLLPAANPAVDGREGSALPVQSKQKVEETEKPNLPVQVDAKAVTLIDAASGQTLLSWKENEKLYPASVTKIMTLLLVAEALDSGMLKLTDEITASTSASQKGGSQIWLKEGETMTAEDLIKAAAVYSANDACAALAEAVAGSEEAFVAKMNERAKQLGMTNTTFENCTGLDDTSENHLTTARDIGIMAKELLKHPSVTQFSKIWMDSLRDGKTQLVNTNKLVRFYEGATGLKTGTTAKAGCCIAASAERGGTHLIAVVLGSPDSDSRFETAKRLLNWGFANYESVQPEIKDGFIPQVRVLDGKTQYIAPALPENYSILVPKGKADTVKPYVDLALDVQAPVEKGQVLGKVTFKDGDTELGSLTLTSPEAVEKITYGDMLVRIFQSLAGGKK